MSPSGLNRKSTREYPPSFEGPVGGQRQLCSCRASVVSSFAGKISSDIPGV